MSIRKKMKNNRIIKPYLLRKSLIPTIDLGSRAKSIWEPSNGGIGIKLKIAKRIFTQQIKLNIKRRFKLNSENWKGKKRINNPKIKAKIMFDSGPAKATFASPYFLSLKLRGLTGTGFAQPKTTGLPVKIRIPGKIIEPNHSRCFMGFKVSRPAFLAVKSPR